jgi:hypothetical protein
MSQNFKGGDCCQLGLRNRLVVLTYLAILRSTRSRAYAVCSSVSFQIPEVGALSRILSIT